MNERYLVAATKSPKERKIFWAKIVLAYVKVVLPKVKIERVLDCMDEHIAGRTSRIIDPRLSAVSAANRIVTEAGVMRKWEEIGVRQAMVGRVLASGYDWTHA